MKIASKIFTYSMIVQSLVWIFLSAVYFFTINSSIYILVLMSANAICFFGLALIRDRNIFFNMLIYVFVIINLVLSLTDQMGKYDYLVLFLNIISLISYIFYKLKKPKEA
ncbi:MAG: hypothetical protein AB1Z23_08080 [Eubacteriales bacterium]